MAQVVVNPDEEVVLGEEIGHVRVITLNQPRRLNVISSEVVELLARLLEKWEKDDDAELILIKGSGRAFSAGGDLKMFYDGRASKDPSLEVVYRMYWLCYHIHTYKKTQVALVHGISMGGGASLMVPMKFSVVTEKSIFATPEASIGFHTDCGFSYMLSHLPGHLGEFLGLTGARLNGAELVAAGFATHFVPLEKLPELQSCLISLNSGEEHAVKSAIEEFSTNVEIDEQSILNKKAIIDECFSKDSVEEILTSFEAEAGKEGNGWIGTFLKGLKRSSPTALKITLQSIREGRKQTLAESLKKEFRLTMNILRTLISSDVYEGIRAVTIDKDNAPKWDPPTLEAVDAEKIKQVFQPYEEHLELKIPSGEDFRWQGKYEDSPYATSKSCLKKRREHRTQTSSHFLRRKKKKREAVIHKAWKAETPTSRHVLSCHCRFFAQTHGLPSAISASHNFELQFFISSIAYRHNISKILLDPLSLLKRFLRFFSQFFELPGSVMAQLLSPVCTDTLKYRNSVSSFCPRSRCPAVGKNSARWSSYGGRRKGIGRIRVASQESVDVAEDYYAVLGLLPDATPEQIKKAYYNCMKSCHPDLSGDDPETTNFCMFINEIYEILSDPVQRMVYDEIHGYALTATNPFFDESSPKDHVFVDEFSCIGCKNCANVCSDVFAIEEDFGRARAYNQSGLRDSVEQAVESCPVDCIHWTSAAQLSLLEDEMRRVERVNVALMLSGMGSAGADVFRMASMRWEKRQAKVLAQAKVRMMKQKDSDQSPSYWDNVWGKPKEYENTEEEVKERAARAAAAARRWREYSRRGADKRPSFKLPEPEAVSNKD